MYIQEQYIFLHDAILESVTCGDTEISSANLRFEMQKLNKINPVDNTTPLQTQFKVRTFNLVIMNAYYDHYIYSGVEASVS